MASGDALLAGFVEMGMMQAINRHRVKEFDTSPQDDVLGKAQAKVEASVEHIQKDIAEIKVDVREFRSGISALNTSNERLTERVSHLPSKEFIVKVVLLTLAVIAALITFQGSIRHFLKLSH
jgi:septal ring factor EnvC (AmiA/AmiB activator)